ncbi:MAG: hypothetical protein Q9212_000551 [Teloschistes hypoglaucus]
MAGDTRGRFFAIICDRVRLHHESKHAVLAAKFEKDQGEEGEAAVEKQDEKETIRKA